MAAMPNKEVLYLNLSGQSRADIIKEATELGRKWFEPRAFDVAIRHIEAITADETSVSSTRMVTTFIGFEADVEVIER